jgi:hypothetical protein
MCSFSRRLVRIGQIRRIPGCTEIGSIVVARRTRDGWVNGPDDRTEMLKELISCSFTV